MLFILSDHVIMSNTERRLRTHCLIATATSCYCSGTSAAKCANIMASSHREHRQDKTVLSCLVGVHDVNWIGDKTRLSATENFETVLFSLEMWCEMSLVLSWPNSHGTCLPIVMSFGSWVKTSSQMRSHRRHDWTKLFRNFQSPTVLSCRQFSSHREHRQDKTRQSCLVGVGGVN